jgi:hypothetical protein
MVVHNTSNIQKLSTSIKKDRVHLRMVGRIKIATKHKKSRFFIGINV